MTFGTTQEGGAGGGTVFEIARSKSSYASTPLTLASFHGANGTRPDTALTIDPTPG